ncbi:MAG: CRISPR-associated protein Cas4 [Anaerolineae bacterium]
MTPTFRVSDLKQYFYCQRIVYYLYCLPHIRPTTFLMEAGTLAGEDERQRERRRSLKAYGLRRGTCCFNIDLCSDRLALTGRLDMAIRTDDNTAKELEAVPVDYKLSAGRVVAHFFMQVTAYGMLLEEQWKLPVHRGFIYLIPARRARMVPITPALRRQVETALEDMRRIVTRESMPPPPRRRGKCAICEFRRFCNDV